MGIGNRLIGHKPGRIASVDYWPSHTNPRVVTTKEIGPSNRFVHPSETEHVIRLPPRGGDNRGPRHKAYEYSEETKPRRVKTGVRVGAGAGVAAVPVGIIGAASTKEKRDAKKVKKSLTVSAFGVDHAY